MRTYEVGIGSPSLQPKGPLMTANLNQSQKPPEVGPASPDDAAIYAMDGIDGSDSDLDFPDSDTDSDSEAMLIDVKPPDAEGNPERVGSQYPPSNHEVSALSIQTSPAPLRERLRDPDTHERSPGAESPTNSKYCWICKIRPVKENSSLPTCGPMCTLELDKMQSQRLGNVDDSNRCFVCKVHPKQKDSPTCGWACTQVLERRQSQIAHPGQAEIRRGHMSNPHHSVHSGHAEGHGGHTNIPRHTTIMSYASVAQTPSPSSSNRVPMCQVCQVRPRFRRGSKIYPTCGLNCAAKLQPAGKVEMCDFCKQRPKVVLNGKIYPQCGRTCRDKARAAATGPKSNPGTCTTCLNCWKASADPPVEDFCSPHCKGIVESKSPILLEVPRGHVSFDQVENVFKDSWKQVRGPSPSVKKIYMVCLSRTWDDMFGDYGAMRMPGSYRKKAQPHIRWIDMSRECKFGDPGNTKPCLSPKCAICSILQASYNPHIFGCGILTTSLPKAVESTSNNNIKGRTSKVALLTKAHFSKMAELPHYYFGETAPPPGFDAVGVRQFGTKVDHIYVFDNRAVRPIYLISFD